jgi:hypothetical protein
MMDGGRAGRGGGGGSSSDAGKLDIVCPGDDEGCWIGGIGRGDKGDGRLEEVSPRGRGRSVNKADETLRGSVVKLDALSREAGEHV